MNFSRIFTCLLRSKEAILTILIIFTFYEGDSAS